jgi:carboxymethylenebutenolidase
MVEQKNAIEELVHLYADGAFSRRELMERVSKHVGGIAAALAALAALGIRTAEAQTACPSDVRVAEGAPGIQARPVSWAGENVTVLGYLAYPDPSPSDPSPAVIVVHENRGLVEHIKDVTRRAAAAGFVALGVDLLSRQGGSDQFTDPVQQQQAYSRTTQIERRSDLASSLDYLKHLDFVRADRIGTVGFCAGGGNVWDMALNLPELAAATAFYGTPTPAVDQLDVIQTPVLAIYAELDRALSIRMADVMSGMLTKQKTFAFRLYEGVGHAFHNDTGPAYNPTAACDAWAQTVAWFNKFLRR